MAAADAPNAERQLAYERARRGPAAIAAVLAGVLTLGGGIYSQTQISSGFPTVGELQALAPALRGQVDAPIDPGTAGIQYINAKATGLIATSVVIAIGTLLSAYVLLYLYRAARARRPETPTIARYTALYGAPAVALLGIALQVITTINAHDFVAGADRSRAAVDAVRNAGLLVGIQSVALAGQLAFAFAFVIVSLNAMRAGLLTRFMGVLGIIVGVLFIVPIGAPVPVVQCFWLVALAPLLLGRWPQGTPPAWITGEAQPWPSQQRLREERQRAAAGEDGPATAPVPVEDGPEPAPAPHPSSARKRRKRRR